MVESSKSSKKKLVLVVIVVLVGLIGGGYFFVSRSSAGADDAASPSTTQPGRVVRLAPTTLNLTDGRVLKVGVALQTVAKPKDKELQALLAVESKPTDDASKSPLAGQEAKALDETIRLLGDRTYDELSAPGARAKVRDELSKKVSEAYEGDVTRVYFTEFVMS